MLFPHLLNGEIFLTEAGESDEFFLNLLQTPLPLSVSGYSLRSVLRSKPILVIQFLDVCDLRPETRNLFAKDFKMVHNL